MITLQRERLWKIYSGSVAKIFWPHQRNPNPTDHSSAIGGSMSRRIDDYEYYDRPFNHRAAARHYYYHNSRHIGGGASAAVAALVAVVVVLILQVWTPLSSQTASTRTAEAEMEPPISRVPTNTRFVTAD